MFGPEDLPVALFTARRYEREVVSGAPVSGIVLKLTDVSELTFEQAVENYWQFLNRNACVDAIALVAMTNNLVLDEQHNPELHAAMAEQYLRPEYRQHLRAPLEADPHPTFRIAFSRLGSLLTLKLLISLLPDHATETNTPEPHLAGDLAVLANEFTGSSSIREGNAPSPMELILEFVPRWEIDNPPDLAYSWSRTIAMLEQLRGDDPTVRTLREAIALDIGAARFHGLTVEEWVAAAFAVFTQMKRLSPADPIVTLVDAQSIAGDLGFSADIVQRFLSGIAITLPALKAKLQPTPLERDEFERLVRSDLFATDTVVLRQNPVIALPNDKFLVLDRHFVSEMVSSGLYWQIFESLEGSHRERLRELWGRLFELYVFDLLGHYYPAMSQLLRVDAAYPDGQIDALLDLGDVVIVFEIKASLLLRNARFSRDPTIFEQDIRRKFVETSNGKAKALRQLADAASAIARGTVATATRPRRIFPVLVADEASLQSLGVNHYLNELFAPLIAAETREVVAPLTVMAVEELEELLPYVSTNTLSWATFLGERFAGGTVALESVHQAIYVHQHSNGVAHLRNDFLLATFRRIWEEMISIHRTGEAATPE
ncbi:MAG TPA: hypothetical protein VFV51_03720 [Vicinamibacterales bacterium]|nr:hypothetical protein [Vicinamibacterales bacterium]